MIHFPKPKLLVKFQPGLVGASIFYFPKTDIGALGAHLEGLWPHDEKSATVPWGPWSKVAGGPLGPAVPWGLWTPWFPVSGM